MVWFFFIEITKIKKLNVSFVNNFKLNCLIKDTFDNQTN